MKPHEALSSIKEAVACLEEAAETTPEGADSKFEQEWNACMALLEDRHGVTHKHSLLMSLTDVLDEWIDHCGEIEAARDEAIRQARRKMR